MYLVYINKEAINLISDSIERFIAIDNIIACESIETADHHYLEVKAYVMPPKDDETHTILIPHAFVLLIHLNEKEKPLGFLANFDKQDQTHAE